MSVAQATITRALIRYFKETNAEAIDKEEVYKFLRNLGLDFADCVNRCEKYERPLGTFCCKNYDVETSECVVDSNT